MLMEIFRKQLDGKYFYRQEIFLTDVGRETYFTSDGETGTIIDRMQKGNIFDRQEIFFNTGHLYE